MPPQYDISCPFCHGSILPNDSAGFAYTRSRVAAHFEACQNRPRTLDRVGLIEVADRVAGLILPLR